MKAIVVHAPFSILICTGDKTIETRVGPPAGEMRPDGVKPNPGCGLARRERIAIVNSKSPFRYDDYPEAWDRLAEAIMESPDGAELADRFTRNAVAAYPLGTVVGTVVVDDALPVVGGMGVDPSIEAEIHRDDDRMTLHRHYCDWRGTDITDQLPLGDFAPGRWGWLLSDPQSCDPIPCKGKQGVFVLPDDIVGRLS